MEVNIAQASTTQAKFWQAPGTCPLLFIFDLDLPKQHFLADGEMLLLTSLQTPKLALLSD